MVVDQPIQLLEGIVSAGIVMVISAIGDGSLAAVTGGLGITDELVLTGSIWLTSEAGGNWKNCTVCRS